MTKKGFGTAAPTQPAAEGFGTAAPTGFDTAAPTQPAEARWVVMVRVRALAPLWGADGIVAAGTVYELPTPVALDLAERGLVALVNSEEGG